MWRLVVLWRAARSWREQAQERAQERAARRRSEAARGPSLELQAWKALRKELIENEHHNSEQLGRRISAPTGHVESELIQ
ncbi:hypothetical protein PybrP1_007565 [[Pythium] brassicae (nom. inval.)]|nr:hypothetical protein PybrP1_007565 [[Pythium] brassicae (nom. inval.)]